VGTNITLAEGAATLGSKTITTEVAEVGATKIRATIRAMETSIKEDTEATIAVGATGDEVSQAQHIAVFDFRCLVQQPTLARLFLKIIVFHNNLLLNKLNLRKGKSRWRWP